MKARVNLTTTKGEDEMDIFVLFLERVVAAQSNLSARTNLIKGIVIEVLEMKHCKPASATPYHRRMLQQQGRAH